MQTTKDFMSDLIENTESGKHRQFQLLRSWQEYSNVKKIRRAHVILVASIKESAETLLKKYCKTITTSKSDVFNLLAYCTTTKVLNFYEEELKLLTDMIVEYECYLAAGNWLDFVLGTQRPSDKLWDHRS